jgi:crotonobetainyl-CoA:carnitine CoA-transferase CaiB-like acyl-CoA transferase
MNVTLDLKSDADRRTLLQLVERADGLIEGARPGVMERLGLGPNECLVLNPRLVYGRVTGWASTRTVQVWAGSSGSSRVTCSS